MSIQAILLPVFAQVLLMFVAFGVLVGTRQRAFASGLQPQSIALGEDRWPVSAKKAGAAYSNMFELPLLYKCSCPSKSYFYGWTDTMRFDGLR